MKVVGRVSGKRFLPIRHLNRRIMLQRVSSHSLSRLLIVVRVGLVGDSLDHFRGRDGLLLDAVHILSPWEFPDEVIASRPLADNRPALRSWLLSTRHSADVGSPAPSSLEHMFFESFPDNSFCGRPTLPAFVLVYRRSQRLFRLPTLPVSSPRAHARVDVGCSAETLRIRRIFNYRVICADIVVFFRLFCISKPSYAALTIFRSFSEIFFCEEEIETALSSVV